MKIIGCDLIAFAFSMAVSRYDQRKNYEEQEANAIGTEYVRANQLSPRRCGEGSCAAEGLRRSAHPFLQGPQRARLQEIDARTAQLQIEMWAEASTSSAALPAPISTFVLGGMNDVLNSQGYTQAAWWNRIPIAAWMLLIAISIFCNLLIGYDAPGRSAVFLLILPIALSIALFLIADIDSPRHGIIGCSRKI